MRKLNIIVTAFLVGILNNALSQADHLVSYDRAIAKGHQVMVGPGQRLNHGSYEREVYMKAEVRRKAGGLSVRDVDAARSAAMTERIDRGMVRKGDKHIKTWSVQHKPVPVLRAK